jgi:hypothetical protein
VFVFGLADPVHIRLVRALAVGGDVDVLVTEPPLAAACAADGIPHRTFADIGAPFPAAEIAGAQTRAAELVWRPELEARSMAHFRTRDGHGFWPAIRAEFVGELERAIADGVQGAELARHLLTTCDLRLAVAGFDMTPWARGFIAALDQAGVPSLHVPHGLFARTNRVVLPGCSEIHATRVAVGGKFSRAVYAENGQPVDRVVVTGVPRWDVLPALQRLPPAVARAQMGLAPGRPLVVYATTWVEMSRANVRHHCAQLAPLFRAVLRGVARAGRPAPQLVVKFHPTEVTAESHAQVCEGYAALCRAEGAGEVRFAAGDRLPWLAAADLVVSVNSTIALETVLAGRTALNVLVNPADRGVLYDEDTAIPSVDVDDVEQAIGPLISDPALRRALAARRPATVVRYNFADDGAACERVAAEARRLLLPAPAAGRVPSAAPLLSIVAPVGASLLRAPLRPELPVEVLRPPGGGDFTAACNVGAARARGRFVVFLDDGLPMPTDWLDTLVPAVQGSAGGMVEDVDAEPPRWIAMRRAEWVRRGGLAPGALERDPRGGLVVAATRARAASRAAEARV